MTDLPPLSTLRSLSDEELLKLLPTHAKYKERSLQTHNERHAKEFESLTGPLKVVLIGDSMIERMLAFSGSTTFSAQPLQIPNLPSSINLGVGGDKIENVLYRMDLGLWTLLSQHKDDIQLIILHVGTNNLRPKGPFREAEVWRYMLLVEMLKRLLRPGGRLLCTGLIERKDVDKKFVEANNATLKMAVEDSCEELEWSDPPEMPSENLVDHVHLNEEGDRVWDEALWPVVGRILDVDGD